jgi:hypothetical protein
LAVEVIRWAGAVDSVGEGVGGERGSGISRVGWRVRPPLVGERIGRSEGLDVVEGANIGNPLLMLGVVVGWGARRRTPEGRRPKGGNPLGGSRQG